MVENDKDTEIKIFEAATDIFLEKGMDGARMQDIADHAGINKSLLHYYYRSKDKLFNAVFEKVANQLFKRFSPVFDGELTLEEKIRFFYREHIDFLNKNPKLPSFILNEINRNPERIKKLLKNIDINKLWKTLEEQHREELAGYNITPDNFSQLMTTMAAISVFPFAARGLISAILETFGLNYDDYIENRKDYAAEFVIRAIKKGDQLK